MDLVYLLLAAVLWASAIGLAVACERLQARKGQA
jgi:hypothetical protein